MALHGLHILRAMAPRGAEAARAARANKKAVAYWEKTGGEVLPLGQNERGEIPMQPSAAWQDRPFMMW